MQNKIKRLFDSYTLQIWYSGEDKAFIAMIVELPCCKGDGQTREEAIKEVFLSFQGWYEFYLENENMILPEPLAERKRIA